MLRYAALLTVFMLIAILGCDSGGNGSKLGATSSVSVTDLTKSMVGRWGIDGETSLIITQDGTRVVVSAPPNSTWRMDILDAEIVGSSLHFIQKYYLHDGTEHPFNGIACNSIVKLVGADKLEFGMTTTLTPEIDSSILTRIKE